MARWCIFGLVGVLLFTPPLYGLTVKTNSALDPSPDTSGSVTSAQAHSDGSVDVTIYPTASSQGTVSIKPHLRIETAASFDFSISGTGDGGGHFTYTGPLNDPDKSLSDLTVKAADSNGAFSATVEDVSTASYFVTGQASGNYDLNTTFTLQTPASLVPGEYGVGLTWTITSSS